MAEPVSPVFSYELFEHEEHILGAGNTNAMPLPVYYNGEVFYSKWKLSEKELEHVKKTGEIIIMVVGNGHPPINITSSDLVYGEDGNFHFENEEKEDPLEKLAKI